MNIYELTQEAQNLADILSNEELTDDMAADAAKLQSIILDGLIPEKVESYCHVIARIDREAKALREEEKRLAARRKVRENSVKRLKATLHDVLADLDAKRVDAGKWTVTRAKTPASLLVASTDNVPPEFFKQADPTLDKRALLDAVKDGLEIDGVELKSGTCIRIK